MSSSKVRESAGSRGPPCGRTPVPGPRLEARDVVMPGVVDGLSGGILSEAVVAPRR